MIYPTDKYDPMSCSTGDPWQEPDPEIMMVTAYFAHRARELAETRRPPDAPTPQTPTTSTPQEGDVSDG